MGKVIAKTEIKREKGMLYYCGTSSDGNITLCSAVMARGRKKTKKK
jgi:hypothetical protein